MLIRSSRLLALLALALSFAACAAGATDIKPPGDQRVADLPPGAEGGTPDSTVDGPSTDQTSHDATVDGPGGGGDATVDGTPPVGDATVDSTPPSDSTVDTVLVQGGVGTVCTSDNNCTGGTRCLLSVDSNLRICTMTCTQDNPSTTTVNEDTCPSPSTNVCGEVPLSGGGTAFYCLQRCVPRDTGNDCPTQLSCSPSTATYIADSGNAACLIPACKTDMDCPVLTSKVCNGQTGSGCSSAAGEVCVTIDATTARCALSGKCNTTSGLCVAHTRGSASAKIGDPCQADVDCANDQICLTQDSTGRWKNGYCSKAGCAFSTLASAQCSSGSLCNNAYSAGLCQKTCAQNIASQCRGNGADRRGDYECYAWDNFTIGGKPVATAPVCDVPIPCTLVSQCSSLGPIGNTTVMDCRDPVTNNVVSSTVSSARCLDLTAAGAAP
ncbi:MAG: hypothetical protein KC503_41490 [Myxococcales bacterium]|nr:hypothetical protein [Myxococcales bacterium]